MKNKTLLTFLLSLTLFGAQAQFTFNDVNYWLGTGSDSAVIVIDFLDGTAQSSYAWGYLFEGDSVTAEQMLLDVAGNDPSLTPTIEETGFLSDMTYLSHAGIFGSPNYWGTWSSDDGVTWISNLGLSEILSNGEWFGCSYMDFNPAIEPGTPVDASIPSGIAQTVAIDWNLVVNNGSMMVSLKKEQNGTFRVFNTAGILMKETAQNGLETAIDMSTFSNGIYVIQYVNNGKGAAKTFVKL